MILSHEEQVDKNLQAFMGPLSKIMTGGIQDEIMGMGVQSDKLRLTRIWKICDEVVRVVTPHSACKNGCSLCCYQAVTVSTAEAKRIAQSTGKRMTLPDQPDDLEDLVHVIEGQQQQYKGKACPFLVKGQCSIYAVRPMSCRLHFNISDNPRLCDTSTDQALGIPNVNLGGLQTLVAVALEDSDWNDIRMFFPG